MKTFTEVCEEICNTMGITCIVADLDEANMLIDQLKKTEFPVFILIPYEVQDVRTPSGLIKSVIPLNFFMLDRDNNQKTVDFKYNEVHKNIVEPMRGKAREFINRLNHFKEDYKNVVDQTVGGASNFRYLPTFSSGDASIHGVNGIGNVPVIEDINGCI